MSTQIRLFKVLFGITTIKKQRLINVCAILDCRKKANYSMVISGVFSSGNVSTVGICIDVAALI